VQSLFHGGARGADQDISAAADQLGWPQIACLAGWPQHGRAAGPIRNRQMLERSLDLASALPLGAGLLVITTPIGRRGKPVKELRLIPAEDAHAMARYFQGTPGTTVSVI